MRHGHARVMFHRKKYSITKVPSHNASVSLHITNELNFTYPAIPSSPLGPSKPIPGAPESPIWPSAPGAPV